MLCALLCCAVVFLLAHCAVPVLGMELGSLDDVGSDEGSSDDDDDDDDASASADSQYYYIPAEYKSEEEWYVLPNTYELTLRIIFNNPATTI